MMSPGKRWYAENSEKAKAYGINRTQVGKAYIDSLKASGCVDCGNKNLTVLEFDHIKDKGTDINGKSKGLARMHSSSFIKIEAEVAKCEVVCSNCHMIRTSKRLWSLRLKGHKLA